MSHPDSPSIVRTGVPAIHSEITLDAHLGRPSHRAETSTKNSLHDDSSLPMAERDRCPEPHFPNGLAKFRYRFREPISEFFGTMILVLFGNGINVHTGVSASKAVASSPKGDFLSVAVAWGMGAGFAVWIAGEGSGAHLNPAWTISQVLIRRFPLRKLPIYILAQVLGAFTAALLVYAEFWRAIELAEGGNLTVPGTASLFATYPVPYLSDVGAFFDEFFTTALLFLGILTVTDKRHGKGHPGLVPFAVFIIVTAIAAAFGMQTSFAMNPARDFGPRLMTSIFYGREVWTFRNQYWLWCPIMATTSGGLCATIIYDIFFYRGEDSKLNSPNIFRLSNPPSEKGEHAV